MSDEVKSRTDWEMGRVPQHVVMECWSKGNTGTMIFWGINLYECEEPYWIEYYPNYKSGDINQECIKKEYSLYSDTLDELQELMNMSDEEYLDKTVLSRNEFVDHIASMIMEI